MANDNGDRTSSRPYQKIPTRKCWPQRALQILFPILLTGPRNAVTLTKLTKTLMHQKNKEGGFINL